MIFPFADDIPARRAPVVTYLIVVANAAVHLFSLGLSPLERQRQVYERGFIPARVAQLVDHRDLVVEMEVIVRDPRFRQPQLLVERVPLPADTPAVLSTLVTSMFMHGGWIHLLGNMWFLWIFGDNVEDRLGHVVYFCFYLLGGVMAAACHWLNDPHSQLPVVGASGAVAAVLGAYAVTWPWARIRSLVFLLVFVTIVDLPALLVLGVWFLTQVLEAQKGVDLGMEGGVAWWAHIGGFLAGAVLMPLLAEDRRWRPRVPYRGEEEEP